MSESPAELFLNKHGRKWKTALDKQFTPEQQQLLNHRWRGWWARKEQLAPEGDWFVWLLMGGRGSGKTRGAAEYITELVRADPGCRIALVGATPGDARDVMVEGPSGVCNVGHPDERPTYEPSKRAVYWPNGSQASVYSAYDPGHLHGPEHHYAWCDEIAVWKIPKSQDMNPWTSLVLGMRLGTRPRVVVSTTPRRVGALRTVLERDDMVMARMPTYDNALNLSENFIKDISMYEGTSIGRAYIHGHMVEEVEGALWKQSVIDASRIANYPPCTRIYVGVDPPGGVTECGIVTAGADQYEEVFIIEDASLQASPEVWGREVILQWDKYQADAIVAEKNYGGDMVRSTIEMVAKEMIRNEEIDSMPLIKDANASRGKYIRAEPVAALWEQGRGHMVGMGHDQLEGEMTTFVPGEASPNRLDAMVWAVSKCVKTKSFVTASWV